MIESTAILERVRRINADYQSLELAVTEPAFLSMKPGQSLLARAIDKNPEIEYWDPYLREQWWRSGTTTDDNLLRVERPAHLVYEPGQLFSLMGPVGQPYRFRRNLRNVLLVAYNTEPTPLVIMAPLLKKNGINTTLVLLGIAREYDTAHLPAEIEIIRGDDKLEWDNKVMTLGWADQIFVVVGHGDELQRFAEVAAMIRDKRHDVPAAVLFGVFQPILPCGTGACAACTVRTKDGLKLTCVDGPAFDLMSVKLP
ncbi:MAG: hypothetical protein ACPG7F_04945 [Aggregatilineales bacterium]